MKYLKDLTQRELKNKICLLRVDLNIDDTDLKTIKKNKFPLRLEAILPTINFLRKNNAKIVILSHRGRPSKAQTNKEFSLKHFIKIFSILLKEPVNFIGDFDFLKARSKIDNSSAGSVFLLENLRFIKCEEENNINFAKKLADLGDIYINDAFAVSHRKNASITAITNFLPSYAGFLMEKEIKNLSQAFNKFKKPFVVILGGAKISDKIGLINNFYRKADYFLLGGGIATTLFASQGLPVGNSLYEKNWRGDKKIIDGVKKGKIILPIDVAVKKNEILDIGPLTIKKYSDIIKKAETIIWNGPMGYFEDPRFAKGSKAMAEEISKNRAFTVIGGGETTAVFILKTKIKKLKSNIFLSTGGGAMLEYLAGGKLPGLKALK